MCASCDDIVLILRAPWTWPTLTNEQIAEELELHLELNALMDDHHDQKGIEP